ncbi:hypothetical protein JCM8547_000740 [Rhodosporidiobolus lusitaniae]
MAAVAAAFPPSPAVGPSHAPSGRQLDQLESAQSEHSTNGRRTLRVAICTENFLPKTDGVTRTLAMLLEHLQAEGHQAMILSPSTPLTSYAGAEVVATKGIPLLGVYRGLGLNFLRPRFIRKLREFKPDVCMFVDPIWLCAQTIPAVRYYFPDLPLVSSYHTNLAGYASLFGFSFLTPPMWAIQRNLHGRCDLSFCPSRSTAQQLESQGFRDFRIWPRGVDIDLFRPSARDYALRQSWGISDSRTSSPSFPYSSSSNDDLPPLHLPPPYSASPSSPTPASSPSTSDKLVVLYVGRISFEKNLRLLIESFRGLEVADESTGRPACQLVFVGDGPARGEIEKLCEQYRFGALFLGFKKGAELATVYASADVFAFPSFTETFGQVVSEAQASQIPVVGLKAEGVSDLVEHRKTGLLLDLNDLLPANSFANSSPPPYTSSSPSTLTIPTDPHALFARNSPTFPLAVSRYRSLLVEALTNHSLRREMGQAAHDAAIKRSWFAAMEKLVDGFRELAAKKDEKEREKEKLKLSRASTIELDVVCDAPPLSKEGENDEGESTGTTTPKRRRLLRLNGVLRRTGGKLRDGSVSLQPLRSWLAPKNEEVGVAASGVTLSTKGEGEEGSFTVRFFEIAVLFLLLYVAVSVSARYDVLPFLSSSIST